MRRIFRADQATSQKCIIRCRHVCAFWAGQFSSQNTFVWWPVTSNPHRKTWKETLSEFLMQGQHCQRYITGLENREMITLSRRGVFAYSEENVRTTALKLSSGPAIASRLASLNLLVTPRVEGHLKEASCIRARWRLASSVLFDPEITVLNVDCWEACWPGIENPTVCHHLEVYLNLWLWLRFTRRILQQRNRF